MQKDSQQCLKTLRVLNPFHGPSIVFKKVYGTVTYSYRTTVHKKAIKLCYFICRCLRCELKWYGRLFLHLFQRGLYFLVLVTVQVLVVKDRFLSLSLLSMSKWLTHEVFLEPLWI